VRCSDGYKALAMILIATAAIVALHFGMRVRQQRQQQLLASERLAVYRALLFPLLKDVKSSVYMGDRTASFDMSHFPETRCWKGLDIGKAASAYEYHFHPDDLPHLWPGQIVLVDVQEQGLYINGHLLSSMRGDYDMIPDSEFAGFLYESRAHGFNGPLMLSEIHFDRNMKFAVASYGFLCGGLCGNGETWVLEKSEGEWTRKSQCDGWAGWG